jgi:hypothetical protein
LRAGRFPRANDIYHINDVDATVFSHKREAVSVACDQPQRNGRGVRISEMLGVDNGGREPGIGGQRHPAAPGLSLSHLRRYDTRKTGLRRLHNGTHKLRPLSRATCLDCPPPLRQGCCPRHPPGHDRIANLQQTPCPVTSLGRKGNTTMDTVVALIRLICLGSLLIAPFAFISSGLASENLCRPRQIDGEGSYEPALPEQSCFDSLPALR